MITNRSDNTPKNKTSKEQTKKQTKTDSVKNFTKHTNPNQTFFSKRLS